MMIQIFFKYIFFFMVERIFPNDFFSDNRNILFFKTCTIISGGTTVADTGHVGTGWRKEDSSLLLSPGRGRGGSRFLVDRSVRNGRTRWKIVRTWNCEDEGTPALLHSRYRVLQKSRFAITGQRQNILW